MANPNTMAIVSSAALGAADGFLARQDVNDIERQASMIRQRSFMAEVAALVGGLFLVNQGRSQQQLNVGEGLTFGAAALLSRRGGVQVAERSEDPPALPAGAGAFPMPAGTAAPRVFAGSANGRAQFHPSAGERLRTRRQNAFV